jgi:Uma2 family endonuclease
VTDIPGRRHGRQVDVIRQALAEYRAGNRGQIDYLAGSHECKILLAEQQSERHPDVAVYKLPPTEDEDNWATWVPEIVIEVVSPSSEHRDYVEKRAEYLAFGVREYWIVNADRAEVLVLRRSGGRWVEKVVRPGEVYQTRLLPGFELHCDAVFAAADAPGR